MEIIKASHLSKRFGDFRAVDDISFTVKKGEVFGFLGPNGAGKTTTINMLIGLLQPSSGKIEIATYDGIKQIKKVQGIIGVVPDESNLYDDLTGYENLVFVASLYGLDQKTSQAKADQLLATFDLTAAKDRPFKAYSKGMKRKLTLAAGIIHDPQILFLDEPTTGIDVLSARLIREMIKELNRKGTTIFLTTHYIEDAQRLCDRIGFIVGGKIVRIDELATLLKLAALDHSLVISGDLGFTPVKEKLLHRFPGIAIGNIHQTSMTLVASFEIELMPILEFLTNEGYKIKEARLIQPSLEDVFVSITGTALENNQSHKGGKNK